MVSFPPARRLAAIAALVALAAVPARAQQKLLTIDDLYDPVKRVNFGPPGFGGGYTWINDKEFIRLGGGPRGAQAASRGDVMKVDAETGAESPLYDASKLEAALAKLPGVTAAEAARASHMRGTFTRDYTGLALTIGDDIYYWPLGGDAVTRLTSTPGAKEQLEFSPDGRLLAYLLNSNLYVSDVAGHERALTTDGTRQGAQRQARLGVRGRGLRPRPAARVLVEPRLLADRISPDRRHAGAELPRRRSHSGRPGPRADAVSDARAIRTRS